MDRKRDLNLLPAVLAIYETRGVSQPALSATPGRLRVVFTDQLFVSHVFNWPHGAH